MSIELHPPTSKRVERLGRATLWSYAPVVVTTILKAPRLSGARLAAETRLLNKHVRLLQPLGPHPILGKKQHIALIAGLPIDRFIQRFCHSDGPGVLVATRNGSVLMVYPHHRPFPQSVVVEAEMLNLFPIMRHQGSFSYS